jgi:hypothetical protein
MRGYFYVGCPWENLGVPGRKKIDMQQVLACMNTICSKCQAIIEPAQLMRLNLRTTR